MPNGEVTYNSNARPETFFARDNVHNFITWCRRLGIFDCLLFESDDLILRKNEKSVILCLLEVSFFYFSNFFFRSKFKGRLTGDSETERERKKDGKKRNFFL